MIVKMKNEKRGRIFKGIISLIILKLLWNHASYGYSLEREISRGLGENLSSGEIYSILRNLEIRGLVKSAVNPEPGRKRKYYEISAEGREYLLKQARSMDVAISYIEELRKFVHSVADEVKS